MSATTNGSGFPPNPVTAPRGHEQKFSELVTRYDIKRLGISLSNTQLIRLERANRFPRRIYLTPSRVVWYAHEVWAWIEARAAEREHRVYSDY